jgi:hypothetical protein
MELENSLACSKELSTGAFPEPDQPSPHNPELSLQDPS